MQLKANEELKNQILKIWKNVDSNITIFDSLKATCSWALQNMEKFPVRKGAWYTAALSWEAAQQDPDCPVSKREEVFPCFPMAWLLMMSTAYDTRTKLETPTELESEALKAVFKDLGWYEDYWEPFFQDNLDLKEEVKNQKTTTFPIIIKPSKYCN